MPETSDDGPSGHQPQPHAAPGQDLPDASPAAPLRRPAWRRRRVLITITAVVAAAVAATVVLWPASRPQGYARLPPPCTLVTAATLAKYVPGATSKPLGPSVPGGCDWHGTSGPLGQRDLVVVAAVFGSPAGVTLARQLFDLDSHATISTPTTRSPSPLPGGPCPVLAIRPWCRSFSPGRTWFPRCRK